MSRRYRFARLRVAVALAAILALSAVAPRAATDASDHAACDAALPLRWIDDRLAGAAVLAEAEREATRIWRSGGIALTWTRSGPDRAIQPDEILVLVRARLAGHGHADAHARGRRKLGRVLLATRDRPSRLIEVALPTVSALVTGEMLFGQPVHDLPVIARDAAIGRGLGRVVAHEIGHWLFGRGHAPDGLMRASIDRRDLVRLRAPSLPPAWPSTALAQLQLRRSCPAARLVRQPVTD